MLDPVTESMVLTWLQNLHFCFTDNSRKMFYITNNDS